MATRKSDTYHFTRADPFPKLAVANVLLPFAELARTRRIEKKIEKSFGLPVVRHGVLAVQT